MKVYHIILGFLITIASSCSSDDINESSEVTSQSLIIEKSTNDLTRNNNLISETLHVSLQYLSFITARIIFDNSDIREEVSTYLDNSQENTISADALFSDHSPVPMLREALIEDYMGNCQHPDINYHRPGIHLDGGGRYSGYVPWHCTYPYYESDLYEELVINNDTELFFSNGLHFLEVAPSHLRSISSTSSPNLSLLRDNEGYRVCANNHLANYYFNIEYQNEGIKYHRQNPMRINTTNDYLLVDESVIVARVNYNVSKK